MYKLNCLIIVLVFSVMGVRGQSFKCGTSSETSNAIVKRLKQHLGAIEKHEIIHPRSTIYVALKFHLVGKDDGTGRISEQKILDQICSLNDDFSDQNIQFYIDGNFNYINDTETFIDHQETQFSVMVDNKDLDAINIFVIDRIDPNSLFQAYYIRSLDWIVINNDQIGSSHTLTHEIGHYFSLVHPFHGWDKDPYDPDKHGSPAPITTSRGAEVELADGSNCSAAGDLLCDTPADYNFNYPRNDCDFEDVVLDPSGKPINPDEKLFMNYFKCPRDEYYFSDQQKQVILAELMSSSRFPIRDDLPNSTKAINQKATMISPRPNETVPTNSVNFEWTAVDNATHYLLEIDDVPNFGSDYKKSIIVTENQAAVFGLKPNRSHFWRVIPFNEYYTCAIASDRTRFTSGIVTSTNHISSVNEWSIQPNPTSAEQETHLMINSTERFEANVEVRAVSGQLLQTFGSFSFKSGQNQIQLNYEHPLSPGMYFVIVQSQRGRLVEKLVIR